MCPLLCGRIHVGVTEHGRHAESEIMYKGTSIQGTGNKKLREMLPVSDNFLHIYLSLFCGGEIRMSFQK